MGNNTSDGVMPSLEEIMECLKSGNVNNGEGLNISCVNDVDQSVALLKIELPTGGEIENLTVDNEEISKVVSIVDLSADSSDDDTVISTTATVDHEFDDPDFYKSRGLLTFEELTASSSSSISSPDEPSTSFAIHNNDIGNFKFFIYF